MVRKLCLTYLFTGTLPENNKNIIDRNNINNINKSNTNNNIIIKNIINKNINNINYISINNINNKNINNISYDGGYLFAFEPCPFHNCVKHPKLSHHRVVENGTATAKPQELHQFIREASNNEMNVSDDNNNNKNNTNDNTT
ncbi:hypothetical protein HELRODRAFT_169464 [Helobdella robusta]|uniref:Uncharacterized protein n=1 Tax=Helobdella robusta TaxID=6412 RepID=T1F1Z1_HELRO|nr:hypothetical protein HELRODRAFT_169464 [Helobdella robusta]ESO08590.1 hypothetical protein HELRODRAFT_169464 [Helobdella robusta]